MRTGFLALMVVMTSSVSAITRGINFFGFETSARVVHMLWCQPLEWHMDKIQELGFNTIRLPVSEDFIMANWDTEYPDDGTIDQSFPEAHMRSIVILDEVFTLASKRNISIILDIHRLNVDNQAPKPFIDYSIYTFVRFMDAWVKILRRYNNRANLIGIDVFNEYQSEDWGDWKNLASITINHIESTFPGRFLYYVEGSRWGGDLSGAKTNPLTFPSADLQQRVYYSIHKYWFSDRGSVGNQQALISSWDFAFGYLGDRVMVGEWGYISDDTQQSQWAEWFVEYLREKGIKNTYFWSYNFDSGDTKGVLLDDCVNVDQAKMELLNKLWAE